MRLIRKVMVAGLIGALTMVYYITAFASESGAYLYGQELVGVDNKYHSYFAIVVGDTDGVIDRNEITFDEGGHSFELGGLTYSYGSKINNGEDYGKPIPELKKINSTWATPDELRTGIPGYDDKNALTFFTIKNVNDSSVRSEIGIVKLPNKVSVSELSPNLKKYVIYAKDMSTNPESWRSDAIGWWYDNGDGTYPVNRWKDINGKSYYFGPDGYMLHDTKTPDGYTVGSDGALVDENYILE